MNRNQVSTLLIWGIIFLVFFTLVSVLGNAGNSLVKKFSYNEFIQLVESHSIERVTIEGKKVEGILKEPLEVNGRKIRKFETILPYEDPNLINKLIENGVQVQAKERNIVWDVIISSIPWILIMLVLWFFLFRGIGMGGNRAFEFGQSRAKIYIDNKPQVTFDDVANAEEAKEDLKEVVEFLKNKEKYLKLGAKIPKGVLLVGPPGVGKTLLAKAVAGEAGVPFLSISGSDFVEMFVGVGAARVRDLFQKAKQLAPAIIFIDELDAVGRMRGTGIGGGHDEREQTLNQLLVEMDGFDGSEGIIVLAATNRPDILDPALLRPGRFDRKVYLGLPDVEARYKILQIHTRNKPLADDVDLMRIARITPGFSGADLANLTNEAALLAARAGRDRITMKDFEEAKDKIIMGAAKKSAVLSEEEKKKVAYHEAGHAIVNRLLPGMDKIDKVSIVPRGMALGVTVPLPEKDRYLYEKSYLEKQLSVLMGGRVAEKLIFGEVSSGAANDLQKATEIAERMVKEFGMSEEVGPLNINEGRQVFLGKELVTKNGISEKLSEIIDREVLRILKKAEKTAEDILRKNIDKLHKLASALLERETISGEEMDEILGIGEDNGDSGKENGKGEIPKEEEKKA